MSLERRTPLRRDTPKTRAWLAKPRARIRQRSVKQAAKDAEWAEVRRQVIARDKTCRAAPLVPHLACWGRAEVHHLRNRSQQSGHTVDGCILLCAGHHEFIGMFPQKAAELGLLILRPDAEEAPDA